MSGFFEFQKAHQKFFQQQGNRYLYKKGQYLVSSNDESSRMFFLHSGLVEASFSLSDGSSRIIGYFLPGMSFTKSGAFFDEYFSDIEYRAIVPSEVYCLSRDSFMQQLDKDQEFNAEYRTWLLKVQLLLIERIVYQGQNTIKKKLLGWLVFMCRYYGTPHNGGILIEIPITQSTMANFLHITRVSVGKEIRKLVSEGIIQTYGKELFVPDLDKLQQPLSK
ncbi:Crp/Fnr family transcriptional regulator [Candidatus Saccharibacteria bacterium]|nr:Crp/Fnr family transcriptional regulator [Candidatus Saccharibacteria bacterium]